MTKHDGRTAGITSPKDRSGLKERWMELSENRLNAVEAESIFEAQKKYLLGEQLDGERIFSMAKALLRRGADPNDTSWYGRPPLELALKTRNEKLVQLLISAGGLSRISSSIE